MAFRHLRDFFAHFVQDEFRTIGLDEIVSLGQRSEEGLVEVEISKVGEEILGQYVFNP